MWNIDISELLICQDLPVYQMIEQIRRGFIFRQLVVVRCCNAGNSSDVTLAFEDAQLILPFSREETDDTDDTNYTEDTDDTDDTDDIDDTDDTDNTE